MQGKIHFHQMQILCPLKLPFFWDDPMYHQYNSHKRVSNHHGAYAIVTVTTHNHCCRQRKPAEAKMQTLIIRLVTGST